MLVYVWMTLLCVVGAVDPQTGWKPPYCRRTTALNNSTTIPRKYGVVLFRAFEMIDVYGPLEALFVASWNYTLDLHLISDTLNPVTVQPVLASMNKQNSSFFPTFNPIDTFDTAPQDLDVLIVPGGVGSRSPDLDGTLAYVQRAFPNVKYLVTVCTGSLIAARAGLLDGKRATTNKQAYNTVTAGYPKVKWVKHARWVVDGKIWTSSGVSAGIDATLGFIECVYGEDIATDVATRMEYVRNANPSNDPFAS